MNAKVRKVQEYTPQLEKPARAVCEAGRATLALALPPARRTERTV